MPKKLPVDYETIFAGYCKGVSLQDLARQYGLQAGTLRSYAARQKWDKRAAEARTALQRSISTGLVEKGAQFVDRISGLLDKQLTVLERKDPEALEIADWEAFTRILERTVNMGRSNYGLDADKRATATQVLVQVQSGAPARVACAEAPGAALVLAPESTESD